MRTSPLRVATRGLPCCSVWLVLCFGCSDDDACERDKQAIEDCGRAFNREVCASEEDRCATACFAELACSDYAAVDRDVYPESLSRCLVTCSERLRCGDGSSVPSRWQCDGAEDCLDGADEKNCTYYPCNDGQLVRDTSRCDGYTQCGDGSDEEECP